MTLRGQWEIKGAVIGPSASDGGSNNKERAVRMTKHVSDCPGRPLSVWLHLSVYII